jgi:hypothetical protein
VVQRADRRPGTMTFNHFKICRLFFHDATT